MSRDLRHVNVPWSGQWVADQLGIGMTAAACPLMAGLTDLVGLAVRRNPRRAHLLVSRVLGKHVPTSPALVHAAGLLLGALTATELGGDLPERERVRLATVLRAALRPDSRVFWNADQAAARLRECVAAVTGTPLPVAPVVLGYAETATGLGHAVADALDAPYLHSTRRHVPGVAPVGGFEEEHSHATSHLLLPSTQDLLAGPGPLVLVDDELSTGTTALNTISVLHRVFPRDRYVIAVLVDLRSDTDRARMNAVAVDLGAAITVVALAGGHLDLPSDVLAAGAQLVTAVETAAAAAVPTQGHPGPTPAPGTVRRVRLDWPDDLPDGARHGYTPLHRAQLEQALPELGAKLATELSLAPESSVLVLGTEELMYVPLRLADELSKQAGPAVRVRFSSTTRSPVLPVDDPGYAIRTRLEFAAHDTPDDGPGPRYAYNVAPPAGQAPFDTVLVVLDDDADTVGLHGPDGLLTQLATVTGDVVVTVIPSHRPTRTSAAKTQAAVEIL